MRKVLTVVILLLFTTIIYLSRPDISYAKLLPRHRSSGGSSSAPISTRSYAGVSVSPSFMPGRGGLKVTFGNVQNAKKISYMLVYETNGKQEGVSGTVSPSDGSSVTRNLQFATCSSGTCVNHGKISNMQFTVTSELTSGKTSIKKFRIRV
ncbi:MAG: hypothetical protein UU81_C0069G0006 [Microgenomates group bacterium GW2011_GWC1_41_8]|uniref:Uncharacterized protein n=3 Tax=Candidatus Roizmaniibacteriota TaxID=1752723 RepID=A0A0G1A557_9BACT|nr:MAG: hypothetical protein UU14_C0002G0062 [Candidatus Roizmanbacteria bacterium GW2011_GWB1_40_7]KKR94181.1 MAG: hypothetical protein UU41_C0011G0008 [Candidatus Roizmanbacteria bacterium GW2011_GWA1_41_13]KKS20513.1 MAG: hypothetical protein UU78_C0061G0004 [Candidatus Roizmanbacteria bacterium GW2011_GWC2_41_7]KKS21728.1 MAG: hypothetical protein UU81_C0069G0006 [Microgenomates group bacterium GW2011_GWC1_41_8]OGK49701.1 MAG: hypothetical protein A3A55_02805 [Candidatus Roizmanbacteria bac